MSAQFLSTYIQKKIPSSSEAHYKVRPRKFAAPWSSAGFLGSKTSSVHAVKEVVGCGGNWTIPLETAGEGNHIFESSQQAENVTQQHVYCVGTLRSDSKSGSTNAISKAMWKLDWMINKHNLQPQDSATSVWDLVRDKPLVSWSPVGFILNNGE